MFLVGVHGHPDHLHDQHRLHELLDRAHPVKSEAIEQIQLRSLSQPANGKTYTLSPAHDEDGKLVLLLVDDKTHKPYVGTPAGLEPLAARGRDDRSRERSPRRAATSCRQGAALFALDTELDNFRVPLPGGHAIHPEGIDFAVQLKPDAEVRREDRQVHAHVRSGGLQRQRNGLLRDPRGKALEPGWKTYIGFTQFSKIVNDPLYRSPFLRVLLWTLVFAVSTVLLSFALGLFLAITLQKKFRGQRVYRSSHHPVRDSGVPDDPRLGRAVQTTIRDHEQRYCTSISTWLFDPWWARVSVLIVSVWLTFPYFFLVNLGALQSIPADLVEAARVDGAGGWQVFRRITLPLLLVSVGPLMIASFAFNFNNFNIVYLLTGGGPRPVTSPSRARRTS